MYGGGGGVFGRDRPDQLLSTGRPASLSHSLSLTISLSCTPRIPFVILNRVARPPARVNVASARVCVCACVFVPARSCGSRLRRLRPGVRRQLLWSRFLFFFSPPSPLLFRLLRLLLLLLAAGLLFFTGPPPPTPRLPPPPPIHPQTLGIRLVVVVRGRIVNNGSCAPYAARVSFLYTAAVLIIYNGRCVPDERSVPSHPPPPPPTYPSG